MSFWNSLRFKMPGIVLLGIIPPMLGAIFFASYRANLRLRQDAQENMASQAKIVANTVSWWHQLNVSTLKQLSQQTDIVSMDPERQIPVLKNLVETHQNIYTASTVNRDGWNVARSNGETPKYYGDRTWFLQAVAGKEVTYQALISRTIKQPAICLASPIRQQTSEITGVVVICTELSTLAEQIGELKFGQTGYAILVDQTGKLLAHPNSALISGTQLHNLSQYPPIKNTLEGRSAFFYHKNEKNINWISYGITLENGWNVAIVQQEAEFLQNQHEFEHLAYLVALVAVVIVSVLTWLLANYLIRPIGKLTTAARAISNGQLDNKVEVKSRDELGILANSFNEMANRLKISFQDLEDRVKQRTSQLNTAKEAAENANQTKDRFLARISHDLRSPLNTIISYAKILKEDPNLRDSQTKGLSIIRKSGIHLLNLIEDILDFSKAKVSKLELHPTHLHWPSFVDGIVGMIEVRAREKKLLFKCETVGNLATDILVDQKRLRQVLINLLDNAIKFTEKGQVTLKVSALEVTDFFDATNSQPQQTLCFEVTDTGMGISPQHLEKIFQPFEQLGQAEQQTKGTGLGLSISKQIVETMGSQLKVQSRLGVGTTFWFDITVPVVKAVPKIPDNGKVKALAPASSGHKILVVDDKEENHFYLNSILKPLGFNVFIAINGLEALKLVPLIQPDLILLDLYMPVKTGFTLVKELRKMSQFEAIPLILMSSSSQEILEKVSYNLGCEGFLTKPIDENKLLALLQKCEILV